MGSRTSLSDSGRSGDVRPIGVTARKAEPVPVGRGSSRHVGRVGALAVALGIGAAAVYLPAVAAADTRGSAGAAGSADGGSESAAAAPRRAAGAPRSTLGSPAGGGRDQSPTGRGQSPVAPGAVEDCWQRPRRRRERDRCPGACAGGAHGECPVRLRRACQHPGTGECSGRAGVGAAGSGCGTGSGRAAGPGSERRSRRVQRRGNATRGGGPGGGHDHGEAPRCGHRAAQHLAVVAVERKR
jgi:hypothetical protein